MALSKSRHEFTQQIVLKDFKGYVSAYDSGAPLFFGVPKLKFSLNCCRQLMRPLVTGYLVSNCSVGPKMKSYYKKTIMFSQTDSFLHTSNSVPMGGHQENQFQGKPGRQMSYKQTIKVSHALP